MFVLFRSSEGTLLGVGSQVCAYLCTRVQKCKLVWAFTSSPCLSSDYLCVISLIFAERHENNYLRKDLTKHRNDHSSSKNTEELNLVC